MGKALWKCLLVLAIICSWDISDGSNGTSDPQTELVTEEITIIEDYTTIIDVLDTDGPAEHVQTTTTKGMPDTTETGLGSTTLKITTKQSTTQLKSMTPTTQTATQTTTQTTTHATSHATSQSKIVTSQTNTQTPIPQHTPEPTQAAIEEPTTHAATTKEQHMNTSQARISEQSTLQSTERSTLHQKTTTVPDGDWSIIGTITGNSFTGKILLPIAIGIVLSIIILAVAYAYCSKRNKSKARKSSRNGSHQLASTDRVMLLADSSEDEF